MPKFRSIGDLTWQQANDSIKISDMPGDGGGAGPIGFVITGGASGLPPSSGLIGFQLFPGSHFADGTDSLGQIGTDITAFNSGNDRDFNVVGGGTINLPDGFFAASVRSIVTGNQDGVSDFGVQFLPSDPVLNYTNNISEPPSNTRKSNPSWDGSKGTVTISTDFSNSTVVNPTAIAFYRDSEPLASVPWVDGITTYSYDDVVFAPGTYSYTAVVYKYGSPNRVSDESAPVSVEFESGPPNFTITGSGGFDLGGSATIIFNIDPSGIYVLVPNKTHDTIYTDVTSSNETVDVAFPIPMIKTFFSGK